MTLRANDLLKYVTREELVRVGFMPFALAELVWDYAGTVVDMAVQMRIKELRRATAALRDMRREFDRQHAGFVESGRREVERACMLDYEEDAGQTLRQFAYAVRAELRNVWPELSPQWQAYVLAVEQCRLVHRVLVRYDRWARGLLTRKVGRAARSVLPRQVLSVGPILDALRGDKPLGDGFDSRTQIYVDVLFNNAVLVEFTGMDNLKETI